MSTPDRLTPATHFIAPDADGDLNLWRGTREDPAPVAVLRECDTDPAVWAVVVAAVSTPDRLTDEERATARLAAHPPATDRDALGMAWDDGNATGLDGWVGPGRGTEPDPEGIDARERYLDRALAARPAPAEEVDPRDPLGIVTPNPKPTCPVPGFGRDHLWATGAFYVGSRLIQSDDYVMCGSCGQIEYDVPEEPTRPAPDPWCREESCRHRHWRSGDMPTHRRGEGCPAPDTLADRVQALAAGRSDASPEGGA